MSRRYNQRNNCMAYALGDFHWAVPRGFRRFYGDASEESLEKMIENLKEDYNLKEVRPDEMVLGKEYVAFRFEDNYGDIGDFHFIKRHKTGNWTHKRGSLPVLGISQKAVFSEVWTNGQYRYNSDIYLFEIC